MIQKSKLILPESYIGYNLPFNDLTQQFADEIKLVGKNNPWKWLHSKLLHEDLAGIHLGDYIKFKFTIADGPELEYTARIHRIYRDVNNKLVIDFWCDELLPDKIKWNDKLTDTHTNVLSYYNNGVSETGWTLPYYCSTPYHYLNALNGYVCYSIGYDSSTSYYTYYFTQEDFTSTGIWNYIPQDLKSYIVSKIGITSNKTAVPNRSSVSYSGYSYYFYLYPEIGVGNLGYLWIPTSSDFYNSLNIDKVFANRWPNIPSALYNHYMAWSGDDGYKTYNQYNLPVLNLLAYYTNLDSLIKYYPKFARLKDRNNPNDNVDYWLSDVGGNAYLNVLNITANKTINIVTNKPCYDENYLPLCFTIG